MDCRNPFVVLLQLPVGSWRKFSCEVEHTRYLGLADALNEASRARVVKVRCKNLELGVRVILIDDTVTRTVEERRADQE